jgi:hypothetical protein
LSFLTTILVKLANNRQGEQCKCRVRGEKSFVRMVLVVVKICLRSAQTEGKMTPADRKQKM